MESTHDKWIISCNLKYYDLERAFQDLSEIDWRQGRNKFKAGDIAFIYCTGKDGKIRYKTIVTNVNISYEEMIDDSKYAKSEQTSPKKDGKYIRLQRLKYMDSDLLSYQSLKTNGLKNKLQGPTLLTAHTEEGKKKYKHLLDLGEYIEGVFARVESMDMNFPLTEELFDSAEYIEGSKRQVTVNAYERSPKARDSCLKIYGNACMVCGFDSKEIYGAEFVGKIHVHHIVPLRQINEQYSVDPKKDLVPVCPNCHMIIHAKNPPYTIEEVKNMLKKG